MRAGCPPAYLPAYLPTCLLAGSCRPVWADVRGRVHCAGPGAESRRRQAAVPGGAHGQGEGKAR